MVAYDVTNPDSFQNVQRWMDEIAKYGKPSAAKMLVGTKSDLSSQRQISTQAGAELAKTMAIPFIETSAKSSQATEASFLRVVEQVMEQREPKIKNDHLQLHQPKRLPNAAHMDCCTIS